ncbi:MAG: EamA family transporter RarD, partial [Sphingomonadaceae bacterium]|nr:EamA family transporter RarD [Sphingomonadaceae bacterium]
MNDQSDRKRALAGLGYGIAAYLIWGLLPAFMRLLVAVPPVEILAHRIVWSVLLLAGVVTLMRGWSRVVAVLRTPRLLGVMTLTALLIAGNWLLYIWAVNSAHIIETSLGYFINPLLNVALGVVVLGERLGRAQLVSVALAGAGVLYLGLAQGGVPWIALGLAISFSLYGFVRKMAPVDPLTGLFAETLLLAPAALTLLLYLGAEGRGSFGGDPATSGLLVASAALTAGPLLMFAAAGK